MSDTLLIDNEVRVYIPHHLPRAQAYAAVQRIANILARMADPVQPLRPDGSPADDRGRSPRGEGG